MEQETDYFMERPVVSAFFMVEYGSFKVTMKMVCADLRKEDSRVYTNICALDEKSRVKDVISIFGSDSGFVIPVRSKIVQVMRMHFERLVSWYGRNSSFRFTTKTTSPISV